MIEIKDLEGGNYPGRPNLITRPLKVEEEGREVYQRGVV